MSISGKDAEILIGELRSKIRLNRLEKIGSLAPKQQKRTKRVQGFDLSKKMSEFSSELNIRGKRVEEVLPELERYMDNALMFNASVLRIVHGKGNGVLREVVRNHFKGYKEVSRISDEHADRGGAGVTLIELK
jgi:DNA mismatch repair protein MutS2